MNDATRSRFVWVNLELPDRRQTSLMIHKASLLPRPAADILAEFEIRMQQGIRSGDCESSPGLRGLIAWGKMMVAGIAPNDAFTYAIEHTATSDDGAFWRQGLATIDMVALEARRPRHQRWRCARLRR